MTRKIGPEELTAYLDGELSPGRRLAVEEAARDDDALAALIDRERRITMAMTEAFAPALEEQVPARLLNAVGSQPWTWPRRVAAVVVCVALGGIIGWQAAGLSPDVDTANETRPVSLEAAAAHAVYSPEVRHAVEVVSSERRYLDRWLSKRLSHQIAAPDLRAQGFELVGGRLLSDSGSPAAQYMYEDANKTRITIYVRPEPGASVPTSLRVAQDRGFRVVHWEDEEMSYAVTGDIERKRIMEVAEKAHDQF